MNLLLFGATGLVGRNVLSQALADDRIARVTAPVRRALPEHPKLDAPVIDFSALPVDETWWRADAVICALGTTMRQAGSHAGFYRVDYDYPLAVARLAKQWGTKVYALNSALGADRDSRFFYNRVKGELEYDLSRLGFASLSFIRPGMIGGEREEFRLGERVALAALSLLGGFLPKRWQINPAPIIAHALLDAAITQAPGINIISSEELV